MNIERTTALCTRLVENLEHVIIGKKHVLEMVVVGLLCQGHLLIEDVPGVGKTVLARSLARSLGCSFNRLQFTPDMLPSDVTGVSIFNQASREFEFRQGPIFAQIVLVDEINRATPKTQAALLESMEEHRVTAGNETFTLPEPFFVLATQNPIEQEGTYPLPSVQQDRFMFTLYLDYLPRAQELEVITSTTGRQVDELEKIMSGPELLAYQKLIRQVPVAEPILSYAVSLAARSRPGHSQAPPFVKEYVSYGASLRGAHYLVLGAKARAVLAGRPHVSLQDIQSVAYPVLRHRIITNFHAESEGIKPEEIIRRLLETVPAPKSGL